MRHESLTWCRLHKHEVDYDLVHFCKQIPAKGCAFCSYSCTLKIASNNNRIVFEIDDFQGTVSKLSIDEIRECINQPLVRQ